MADDLYTPPPPRCHGCDARATVRYRLVPRSLTLTLFDSTARDVLACSKHIESAKKIGTVISAVPLSSEIATRAVSDG